MLSNKMYDTIKWIAQIFLPALGAFYFGIAEVWDLPKANEVVGTIVVIDTLIGVLLAKSSISYKNSDNRFDGEVVKMGDNSARLSITPDDLDTKEELLLKVQDETVASIEKPKKRTRKKI